jgi:glycosyltransferase involved in cell wall biosynthesis
MPEGFEESVSAFPSEESTVFLSVIIPAYNEESNLEAVIQECLDVLPGITNDFELIVVDDCSTDGSWLLLQRLAAEIPTLRPLRNATNIGCHPSSRVGYLAARGQYCYFIPADRQIPVAEVTQFLAKAKAGYDVIYSWRKERADEPHRLLISGLYNVLLRLFFQLRLHDVDSAELLTRRAVETILPHIRGESVFMTVEILLEAQRRDLPIGEVIISHRPRVAGVARGLNLKDLSRVPGEFLRVLFWFWRQKMQPDRTF